MDLNATLFGQMITFALFIWFTLKFVWPPLQNALEQRQLSISNGLAAADRGHKDLALAKEKSSQMLKEAKDHSSQIVDGAHKRATAVLEQAKTDAQQEAQRIIDKAHADVEMMVASARLELQKKVGVVAIKGAEKILCREIDASRHQSLLEELSEQLAS